MKGLITLTLKNDLDHGDYIISYDDDYGYEIIINIDENKKYADITANASEVKEFLQYSIEMAENDENIDDEYKAFIHHAYHNTSSLLQNAEYVAFDFDISFISKYLKNNPQLKNKKIVINTDLQVNAADLSSIFEGYDVYFKLDGNTKLISMEQLLDTKRKMDQIFNEIVRCDLSPLEKAMYAYDLVRNRIYIESTDEDLSVSRDLSSALLGDKIVCAGFANIYQALLEMLGLKAKTYIIKSTQNETRAHMRVMVHLNDEKYGINGIYYFDPTWDCKKKSDERNLHFYSYRHFALTKKQMDEKDKGKYIDTAFPAFSEDLYEKTQTILANGGYKMIPEDIRKTINYMADKIMDKSLLSRLMYEDNCLPFLIPDESKVLSALKELMPYFTKEISANVFLKALFNVRKYAYYSHPDVYPFGLDEFYWTVKNSGWKFEITPEEKLLASLFGQIKERSLKDKMIYYNHQEKLAQNIEKIKLVRVLKNIHNKKANEK